MLTTWAQDTKRNVGDGYWCVAGDNYGIAIAAVKDPEDENFAFASQSSAVPPERMWPQELLQESFSAPNHADTNTQNDAAAAASALGGLEIATH